MTGDLEFSNLAYPIMTPARIKKKPNRYHDYLEL